MTFGIHNLYRIDNAPDAITIYYFNTIIMNTVANIYNHWIKIIMWKEKFAQQSHGKTT